ncbi:hypothetical protein D104_09350 [Marinomonas profundimaris]|uniref:Uncharacterized protein n=1 Tax=Marinomonas profundimaris TaxID=1208321 RepID=W1RZZ6_9GAMM|nr:hypothetical protein D104_09350 [Marinomonas profundimaris]
MIGKLVSFLLGAEKVVKINKAPFALDVLVLNLKWR